MENSEVFYVYQLQLDLKASDDDIGVMFRIQDNSNYYRFDMDSQKGSPLGKNEQWQRHSVP